LRPLALPAGTIQEQQRLTTTIKAPGSADGWLANVDPNASLEAVRRVLAKRRGCVCKRCIPNAKSADRGQVGGSLLRHQRCGRA
jgi:hypothetical protein